MSVAALDRRLIEESVLAGGFLRRPRPFERHAKEWLHFVVSGERVHVLLNFSLTRRTDSDGFEPRVICAVRDARGWAGDVATHEPGELRSRPGRLEVVMGASRAAFRSGRFEVVAELPPAGIRVELELVPVALPMLVNNVNAGNGSLLHWFLLPRLLASGTVESGGRLHRLTAAPAYHDHNWGTFRWGGAFSWTWAYGLPAEASNPWCFILDQFLDRGRTSERARALLVWKGALQERLFRDRTLRIETSGTLRSPPGLRLPRALSLLEPDAAPFVPQRLTAKGRDGADGVDVELECEDVFQVLVPNDDELGLTLINEVLCRARMSGTLAGEKVDFEGSGMLEILGHRP